MLIESFVMLAIIASVMLMSYMKDKREAALEMMPFMFLPIMYVAANYLSPLAGSLTGFSVPTAFTGIIVFAAVVSSLFTGVFASKFKRKYTKAMYCIMSVVFNLVLMLVYIINLWNNV